MGFFRETDGTVVLRMKEDDYSMILLALGFYTGTLSKDGNQEAADRMLGLVNRINEGNKAFTPYVLKKERKTKNG